MKERYFNIIGRRQKDSVFPKSISRFNATPAKFSMGELLFLLTVE